MKNILSIVLFSIFQTMSAQNTLNPCGFMPPQETIQQRMARVNNPNDLIDNSLTPVVFKVKINVFNDENGTNIYSRSDTPFGEEQFQNIIKDLNINYNRFNIFFKYYGFQVYGGTDGYAYLNKIPTELSLNYVHAMSDLCEKGVININFVDQACTPLVTINTTNELLLHAQNYLAYAYLGRPIIIVSMPAFKGITFNNEATGPDYESTIFKNDQLICHEMGHVLGLYHPWEFWFDPNNNYYFSEHVVRSGPDFNADYAGDMIVDTPAQRNFSSTRYSTIDCQAKENQNFQSQNIDHLGVTYQFPLITYGNFMGYNVFEEDGNFYNHNSCLNNLIPLTRPNFDAPLLRQYRFTDGQGAFMRNYILNNVPVINNTVGLFATNITQAKTTVASLYQPYKRDKVETTVLSTTDNGNGTARVCRGYYEQFTFQKGFSYVFPDNLFPDPINTNQLATPFVSTPPFNCPVTILELAPGVTNLSTNTGEAYTVCKGQTCVNEDFLTGKVFSKEELLSMNVTIEQLNEIKVKDPDLYDKLVGQRFYKLVKETATGAKVENVFYKQ